MICPERIFNQKTTLWNELGKVSCFSLHMYWFQKCFQTPCGKVDSEVLTGMTEVCCLLFQPLSLWACAYLPPGSLYIGTVCLRHCCSLQPPTESRRQWKQGWTRYTTYELLLTWIYTCLLQNNHIFFNTLTLFEYTAFKILTVGI